MTTKQAAPFTNDPALTRVVTVKVLRPFLLHGKPVTVGEEVGLEYHLAMDLKNLGKVEWIES